MTNGPGAVWNAVIPMFGYLDDVISFGRSIPEALARLEEVLAE